MLSSLALLPLTLTIEISQNSEPWPGRLVSWHLLLYKWMFLQCSGPVNGQGPGLSSHPRLSWGVIPGVSAGLAHQSLLSSKNWPRPYNHHSEADSVIVHTSVYFSWKSTGQLHPGTSCQSKMLICKAFSEKRLMVIWEASTSNLNQLYSCPFLVLRLSA